MILRFILPVLLLSPATSLSALEFQVRGSQLIASGPVQPGDELRFEAALKAAPGVRTIVLRNSPGGQLVAGLKIADMIRSRSLRTAVSGYCVSACAIIMVGGYERSSTTEFPPEKTFVAFHGAYAPDGRNALANDNGMMAMFARYTGGRMPADLTSRWMKLPQRGIVMFFDPARKLGTQGPSEPFKGSVYVCEGRERAMPGDCEKMPWIDPYSVGVFTSRYPIALN